MNDVRENALKRSWLLPYVGQAESICLALLTIVTNNADPGPCIQTADQVYFDGPDFRALFHSHTYIHTYIGESLSRSLAPSRSQYDSAEKMKRWRLALFCTPFPTFRSATKSACAPDPTQLLPFREDIVKVTHLGKEIEYISTSDNSRPRSHLHKATSKKHYATIAFQQIRRICTLVDWE